jgi:NTE family protein
MAHIGIIEELEKNGFEIKSISGCSKGSVIGEI